MIKLQEGLFNNTFFLQNKNQYLCDGYHDMLIEKSRETPKCSPQNSLQLHIIFTATVLMFPFNKQARVDPYRNIGTLSCY
jgi:hypothetical protein